MTRAFQRYDDPNEPRPIRSPEAIAEKRKGGEAQPQAPTVGLQTESPVLGKRRSITLRLDGENVRPSRKPPQAAFWRRFLALVAAAIAVVGAWLALSSEPRPGIIRLSTIPKDASVRFDTQSVTNGGSPFVILDVKPKVAHSIEVRKTGYQKVSIEGITIEPDQIKELSPVVLRPLQSGFTLNSTPNNAKVWVDGKPLAQQTPVKVTALAAGVHQIKMELNGYLPWEKSIEVASGKVLDLGSVPLVSKPKPRPRPAPSASRTKKPELKRQTTDSKTKPRRSVVLFALGALRIESRPQSQVYIDGQFIGTTPQLRTKLEPGPHQLTLVNKQHQIRRQFTVDIPPGETVKKTFNLIPSLL